MRAGGDLLIAELNCANCHAAAGGVPVKQAPLLLGVAARIKPSYLLRYLADPATVKPGATMPSVFAGVPAAERDAQVKALVHFLVSEGPSLPPQALPRVGDGANGEQLYHLVGCAACHGSRRDPQETSSAIKPLGDVKAKYTLQSLADLLRDPHHIRPGGRMPSLNLSADESRHIAAYLLELPEAATIKFSYYEGNWSKLPNFAELKPLLVGGADKIHQHVANRKRDYYGLRFESTLEIAADGEYSFRLASDDGSRLTIDGRVVVDNDGVHGVVEKTGKAKL
ncbi:MAG: c-type cytochrome, partial [Pirellulaceae bacterium]|nr:c-type cytochrome [Pirellulaceae bacterium]